MSLLDSLPEDLLVHIAELLVEEDLTNFWRLSRVCPLLKAAAEAAVSRRTHLGGDASARCLRQRTTLAEPAVPLGRLLRCMPALRTLDLSGAYWWARDDGFALAAAVRDAPFAPHLETLRLDHCERIDHNALERLCVHDAPRLSAYGAHALPSLRELSVRSCRLLRRATFASYLVALESLDLAWCPDVQASPLVYGAGLRRALSAHGALQGKITTLRDLAPGLRYLDVTGVEAARELLLDRGAPRGLRELRAASVPLADGDLLELGAELRELRRLVVSKSAWNLWADGMFTDAGLAELRRRRPDLEVVLV